MNKFTVDLGLSSTKFISELPKKTLPLNIEAIVLIASNIFYPCSKTILHEKRGSFPPLPSVTPSK